LLALPLQLVFLYYKVGLDKLPEVAFDGLQVLRGGWNNLGVQDDAAVVDTIAVVADAPWRFCAAEAGTDTRLDVDRWLVGHFKLLNDAQRLIAGVHHLHAAHNDALEGIAADRPQACAASRILRHGRKLVEVQVVARLRSYKVRIPLFQPRLQRVGVSDMFFDEVLIVFANRNVQSLVGYEPSF